MKIEFNKRKVNLIYAFVILISVLIFQGCDSEEEECTRIDKIGGGLLPEQEIEVPCDFPEPKPLEGLQSSTFIDRN